MTLSLNEVTFAWPGNASSSPLPDFNGKKKKTALYDFPLCFVGGGVGGY
jgi:hypothetical protein